MTISVVIATFNRAALLEACLEQLERQADERASLLNRFSAVTRIVNRIR